MELPKVMRVARRTLMMTMAMVIEWEELAVTAQTGALEHSDKERKTAVGGDSGGGSGSVHMGGSGDAGSTIPAKSITCSPFCSEQLISDYSYSRGGGFELIFQFFYNYRRGRCTDLSSNSGHNRGLGTGKDRK